MSITGARLIEGYKRTVWVISFQNNIAYEREDTGNCCNCHLEADFYLGYGCFWCDYVDRFTTETLMYMNKWRKRL